MKNEVILGILWIGYGIIHSVLASEAVKKIGSVSECILLSCSVFKPYISLYKPKVHIILFRKTDGFTT
jgi:hypothetical protein